MIIVLKHLAREFSLEPFKMRQVLRKRGLSPKNHRWAWNDEDPQERKDLESIREIFKKRKS